MRFEGKAVAVVGGGSQWGRAVSRRIAAEGGQVLVLDGRSDWVADTCREIALAGGDAHGFEIDTGDYEALLGVANRWAKDGGSLHGLVTHYMRTDWSGIENCEIEEFERTVSFNLTGPVKATKAFLPLLKQARGASILHLGSIDGLFGAPLVASYSAAKGGLIPLTHVMAYEFARYDVRVNLICSGQTVQLDASELADVRSTVDVPGFPGADYMLRLNEATPLKRHGKLSEALVEWAGAAAFLLSDDAAYVTGSTLVVDCGRTITTPGTQVDYPSPDIASRA